MKCLILLALCLVAVNAGSSQPDGCPQNMCYMACEHGFVRDADKCLTCQCNKDYSHCEKQPMCLMRCKLGFRRGLDGCFDCKCNTNLKHCEGRIMCAMACEKGFLKGLDGCDVCKCA